MPFGVKVLGRYRRRQREKKKGPPLPGRPLPYRDYELALVIEIERELEGVRAEVAFFRVHSAHQDEPGWM